MMGYVVGLNKSSLTKLLNWVLVSVVADQTDAVGGADMLGR